MYSVVLMAALTTTPAGTGLWPAPRRLLGRRPRLPRRDGYYGGCYGVGYGVATAGGGYG